MDHILTIKLYTETFMAILETAFDIKAEICDIYIDHVNTKDPSTCRRQMYII